MSEPPAPAAAVAQPSLRARLGLALGVAAMLLVAWRVGILEQVAEPARLRQTLLALGAWGWLAFLGAYTVLQPFGVPGTVFVWAAPLIWPWPVAFALSMTGTMAASVVGFSFARFVARDWVSARVPARFRQYDEALEKRAFATVVALRFIFWMPPLLHAFFGVSRVPFWTHFWGSVVGYAAPLLAVSYFGERLFELARHATPLQWAAVAGATALAVLVAWRVRRWAEG